MKQFVRYISLAIFLSLISTWMMSLYHVFSITYCRSSIKRIYTANLAGGELIIFGVDYVVGSPKMFTFEHRSIAMYKATNYGFALPRYLNLFGKNNTSGNGYVIPIWVILTPLILITLKLWYAPLKAWWRGDQRKGFEVEMKNKHS